MAGRDSSGNFSSAIATFVTGTVIRSNDVQTKFNELGTEITDSLSRTGKGGMQAALKLSDGSAAIPSLTFTAQSGIGFYRAGSYDVRFVTDAAEKFRLTNAGAKVTGTLEVTGDVTVDTNTVKVDTTNNRVGIGSAAPNCTLAVGTNGLVNAAVPVQLDAASSGAGRYYGINKGGALGFLVGYANADPAYGTGATLLNVLNEPINLFVNNGLVAVFSATGLSLSAATASTDATRVNELTLTKGDVKFSGVTNPASTTAITNAVTPKSITKAWATLTTDGAGNVTVADGLNIASATINGSGEIELTFASAFANADYCCTWGVGNGGLTGITFDTQTTTTVEVLAYVPNTGTALSFATTARKVFVHFAGSQ